MRNTLRPVAIEAMETRRMMSAVPTGDALAAATNPQPVALLLPAIQAAREAGTRSAPAGSGDGGTLASAGGVDPQAHEVPTDHVSMNYSKIQW